VSQNGRNARGRKGADGALVLALACGKSVPDAARAAGVAERTVYRRLEDAAFRAAVTKQRDHLLSEAVSRLVAAAVKAVDALEGNLGDESAAVRNKAASTILTGMLQGVGLTEIMRRLEALEERK